MAGDGTRERIPSSVSRSIRKGEANWRGEEGRKTVTIGEASGFAGCVEISGDRESVGRVARTVPRLEFQLGQLRHGRGPVGERIGPTATRTSRNVGCPTAAVIRRTWRLRPSRMVSRSQAVGTFFRNRIGTDRSGGGRLGQMFDLGRPGRTIAEHDPPAGLNARSSGIRSTWTR